jgi:uncharacterized protein
MSFLAGTGPILSFARAGHLDLLRDVVSQLLIPEAVYAEIVVRGAGEPGAREVQETSWIRRERVQNRSIVDRLSPTLHLGERETIVLAKERDALLLIDDRTARHVALQQGVVVVGSLHVHKEARDRGII